MYADDGVVLICGHILSTICDIMQRILYGIEQWCIDRELSVNLNKTEMFFLPGDINLKR